MRRILIPAIAYVASITIAQGAAISRFDAFSENWTAIGDVECVAATYESMGGNPDGHVTVDDSATGGVWYWQAPENFRGNHTNTYGRLLRFDLRQVFPGTANQLDRNDVLIVGTNATLAFNTTNNPSLSGEWTTYEIPITSTNGWQLGDIDGPLATESNMLAVLENIVDIRIRGEFQFGDDVGSLDNVFFGLAPDPTLPQLDIEVFAGVLIDGDLGTLVEVEYADSPSDPWNPLDTVFLDEVPKLYIDHSSPGISNRVYRVVISGAAD